jgi:hypothetical protein
MIQVLLAILIMGCGPSIQTLNRVAREGSIHEQATVKAKTEIRIGASPQVVWKVLSLVNQWPQWNPKVSKATLQGDLVPETFFKWKTGGMGITSQIQKVEPEKSLIWTGSMLGIKAIHKWDLFVLEGDSTRVIVEESLDGAIVRPFIGSKRLKSELESWLNYLKKKSEEEKLELK